MPDTPKYTPHDWVAMDESGVIEFDDFQVRYQVERSGVRRARLEFNGDELRVMLPCGEDAATILSRHRRWIRNNYLRIRRAIDSASVAIVENRSEEDFKRLALWLVETYAKELGVHVTDVRFRRMRSKWGSCSSNGGIRLNVALRHLPERLMRYVIYHEVAHLVEMNHGKDFWNVVARRFPDTSSERKELEAYWLVVCEIYGF